MKKRRLLAIMLVLVMVAASFAGCGKSNKDTASNAGGKNSSDVTDTSDSDASVKTEEPYTVRVMMFDDASEEAMKEVSEAVSKITLEKINVKVEIVRVGFASYGDQLNLALSSNEKLDVFCTLGQNTTTLANNGQIVAMNPYLDTVGKDIKNGVSEENFKCLSVGDQIYGFPTSKETATSYGFIMRQDIVDELGITVDPNKVYTLEEIHDICAKAKELHPDMYPIAPDFTNMYMPNTMDNLDNGTAVLEDALANDPTVVDWYTSDTYKNFVTAMYNWSKEGLVLPDAGNNSESRDSLFTSGRAMGGFNGMNPGNVDQTEARINMKLARFPMTNVFSITGHVAGVAWCIASNSENPEKAMEFLNLAYTDKDVANLLVNGIEGEHYVVVDKEKGIIDYPEGVDGSTTTWKRDTWGWINATIGYTWQGVESETFWEDLNTYNSNAANSIAKGFKFDPTKVQNEITAISNVTAQYDTALQTGSLDPAEALPQFEADLKAAGVDAIVQEKQAQLDAWLAKQ
jgi:putative aldouronate transport system substrate-binding protein